MALEIDDDRVAAAATRLHGGGWWFSARQLYYATCAGAEVPPVRVAPAEVGLGLILVLVGLIIAQHVVLIVLGGIGMLLIATGAVTHVQERRPPSLVRPLALSFEEFERRFLSGGRTWAGLIAPPQTALRSSSEMATEPLVVCDQVETAAVLEANRDRLGEAAIITRGEEPDDLNGRRLIVLHDCDPAGCGLVAELVDRGAEVSDVGINPAEVAGRRLQVVEGAPARLPRDLSGHLDTAQTDWLRSGRRLEAATQSPEELVQRVRAAL
jgi:hypothetical protein